MDPPGALCWKLRAEGRKAVRWDEKRLLWMIVFCSTSSSFLLHLFSSGNSRMSLKSQRKDKISLPSNVSKKSVSLHFFFCRSSGGSWGPLWLPLFWGSLNDTEGTKTLSSISSVFCAIVQMVSYRFFGKVALLWQTKNRLHFIICFSSAHVVYFSTLPKVLLFFCCFLSRFLTILFPDSP